jgi:polyisoprenoid-binding protein YceI
MATWSFEPGHTEAAFRARHMITWVRGLLKDIHGRMEWDRDDPLNRTFGDAIDARKTWTGEPTERRAPAQLRLLRRRPRAHHRL